MKKVLSIAGHCLAALASVIVTIFGGANGVLMAAAPSMEKAVSSLPDGGVSNKGEGAGMANTAGGARVESSPTTMNGIATETAGRQYGDPEMYTKDIDKRITKIRPMATPVDQISRYATAQKADSFEVKYYSVGTRPVKTTLKTAITNPTDGDSIELVPTDPSIFTLDDTIRVVGVKVDGEGSAVTGTNVPDLVLCVCGFTAGGNPIVYAVNGKTYNGERVAVPAITAGTTLVRMGKACGELDVQTGRFNNIPLAEVQYCQNFMIQVEQSTFDKIASKEVDWTFSDIEEDGIFDMRLTQENSYLFGDKACIHHRTKDGAATWFTKGIWWMAGKDIIVGTYNAAKKTAVITDEDLVDISKDLFVGTGIGNKRKVLLCGSDFLRAFSKIQSDKFRLKDTVEIWNLKFKSWETDFGEILTIHHELFDLNGMSDCGFALDPEFLTKKTHLSWSRNILDLKKAGVRNTDAVVLQEVSCLYLRYAAAHARMRLGRETDE